MKFEEQFPSLKGLSILDFLKVGPGFLEANNIKKPDLIFKDAVKNNCLDKGKVAAVINNIKVNGCFLSSKITDKIFKELKL